MRHRKIEKMLKAAFPALLAVVLTAGPSFAVDLMAIQTTWTPSGGSPITMWGFAPDTGDCATAPTTWAVGPELTDTDLVAGDLTINLRNCLLEPVSIVIPGQPATFTPERDAGGRVTAFTAEAAENGGIQSYTWTGVKAGTYLYQSGSHPAKQVQMGLYGALTLDSYPGTSGDVTLLYSEIDPDLHDPTPAAATPLGYHPKHYLVSVNSTATPETDQATVLRFLNAGLDFHVPALNGGHMSLVAEDGNLYPFPKEQYSVMLAAGKTIDALWQPETAGDHVIYDRRGNGMAASLTVTAGTGTPPVANGDSYSVDEDDTLVVDATDDPILPVGVLDNDSGSAPLTAILVSAPSSGTLNPSLSADGSFTYTPNADFNGTDIFSYKANDGTLDSNVTIVTIIVNSVNDAPVAGDDNYEAVADTTLNVAAPGVIVNDTDIDDVSLSVTTTPVAGPTNGTLVLSVDGSFAYTPTIAAPGSDSFVYEVCDAEPLCNTATVNLTIIATPNTAPVAVNDFATVVRNSTATFIDLTGNDSDADGNLKDGSGNVDSSQITITTGTASTRGGTVTVLTNGVNYTPKRNFRGTDTFNYTVKDNPDRDLNTDDGLASNEATVRVNVVRP